MKQQLLAAYQKRHNDFKTVRAAHADEDMAGPFLMSPNEKYASQPNPLLIIGQETYGWDYYVDDLTKQMEVYEKFNLGEEYYASPFWNVARKVEKALGNEPYSCACVPGPISASTTLTVAEPMESTKLRFRL